MTKLEDDGVFELQTKRWTKLVGLRQTLTDYNMVPTGIDLAIANNFDPRKGNIIDNVVEDCEELMAMIRQLDELQLDSTNLKMALAKAFVPGARETYAADLVKLKELIKMRQQMSGMGIQTGCIEAIIAEVFQPLSPAAQTSKPEEVSEASVTKPCSPTVETAEPAEPAELDACATAISKRSTAETGKLAGLEASKTAIETPPSSSTGAVQNGERPARPTETRPVSKGTETGKPAQMPCEPTALKLVSSDAGYISSIGTSIEALDLDSPPAKPSSPLTKASSARSSASTARSMPSTKTASSSSSLSTNHSKPSAKRSAPEDTALGSAQNPICLESLPAPKRQRTAHKEPLKAGVRNLESWRVRIQFVGTMGLHVKTRHAEADMNMVFDIETREIVFIHGQQSLTALYPDLKIDPEALVSVTRPTYHQSKDLKVRFMWLNTDAEDTFLDVTMATKQDCQYLIARLKGLTSFSEVLSSDSGMNRLFKDAAWLVHETQSVVGLSVTKFSENVWVG